MKDKIQGHAAGHSIEAHFDGRSPVVYDIYDTLVKAARKFGPVEQDPKKTSIHLNRRFAFAGISTRRDSLILTVKSVDDIKSPRITKREQASANRWHHEIKLSHPDEIDSEVLNWLERSYEISG
jgi:hypothetical protein